MEDGGQKSTNERVSEELDKFYVDGEEKGLIKKNITKYGERIYPLPGGAFLFL
ncbi:MAG: hypothetical protein BSOLF_0304 [Candidatus Carbobacillus altaicus]|uniref:Uncharacterized protein n=1 Tax=Candidatus Carbonibacillus altaicus TaxID=2163959 RepID=A0A2R6Y108_9BACL|nr:MAG: hypothetical protein BSOLF_0304 [Candidatus Carbobacillus altaicus]